jgi:hypothetical protein
MYIVQIYKFVRMEDVNLDSIPGCFVNSLGVIDSVWVDEDF